MKPTLHMLIGLPGAGKSTFAKTLKLPVIAVDNFLREKGKGNDPNPIDNKRACKSALAEIVKRLKVGESVTYDHTNLSPAIRQEVFTALHEAGLKVLVRAEVVDTDFFTCVERNRGREFDLSPLNIFYLTLAYVPPTKQEGFNRIDIQTTHTNLSSSSFLTQFLKKLKPEDFNPKKLKAELVEINFFSKALEKMEEDWEETAVENLNTLLENLSTNSLLVTPEIIIAWLYKDFFRIITEYFATNHPSTDLLIGTNFNELIFDRVIRLRLASLDLNTSLIKRILMDYFSAASAGTKPARALREIIAILLIS